MTEVNKELLEQLYWKDNLSIRKIGKKLGMTRGQIEHLFDSFNIETRDSSEAQQILSKERKEEKSQLALENLTVKINKAILPRTEFNPIIRKNMMIPIPLHGGDRRATVTIVLSDLHLGDANHLPETYWSTIYNIQEVLRNIKSFYNVTHLLVVLNGDVVAGRDVFRFQELKNLIQRGHWQVFLAEIIIKDTLMKLAEEKEVDCIAFLRGTHESLSSNFILYLKRLMNGKTKYLSHGGVLNIAADLGEYDVLFTHGYGYADVFPVSSNLMRDVSKMVGVYKNRGVSIERVCSGHSHWMSSGLIVDDMYWEVTGGFQKWEYTLSQRPAGAIVYLYNNGECVALPVRPDMDVELREKQDPGLEYKNLVYYGNFLLKHLREIEEVAD